MSLNGDSLHFSSISQLSRLLQRRELSSLELTRLFLARLEALGPRFNAISEIARSVAEKQARAADRRIKAGDQRKLCGIPFGVKDLLATAGIPTRWGCPVYRDQIFDFDAAVVERLYLAGAVLVGKLSMLELASAGSCRFASSSLDGPGLNPWDITRWSGGSSQGSAAAVAAGLVPFAIGSETGGSITIPAAFCGITGLRPTFGTVSRYGSLIVSWSADKLGPMAHSADDCAHVLAAIAGIDQRDAATVDWKYRRCLKQRFRLGVLPTDFTGEAAAARCFEQAIQVFVRAGFDVREVEPPKHDYEEIFQPILAAEAASSLEALIRSPRLDDLIDVAQRERLREYVELSALIYARALERRLQATRDLRSLFVEVDGLVAPTLLTEAPNVETDLRTKWDRRGHHAVMGAVTGVPQVTIPMGFGPKGLPLGLSITGDLFADGKILRIASLYQRATEWHLQHPHL